MKTQSDKVKSVGKLFENSFRENWDRPALSNFGGETMTYGDLSRKIAWLHLLFKESGISRGDKIAVCGRNQVNWAVSFLAILTYGAVPVPILHEFKPSNIQHLVNHSDSRLLFIAPQQWDSISELEFKKLDGAISLNGFKILQSADWKLSKARSEIDAKFDKKYPDGFSREDLSFRVDSPSELALINYTSGTSGFSKGVMIPYRAVYSNILFAAAVEPHMNNTSRILSILPSAHMFGMMYELLFEMSIGAHVYFLLKPPSPRILIQALQDIRPNAVVSVPMVIEKIYKKEIAPALEKGIKRIFLRVPIIEKVLEKKVRQALIRLFGGNFKEVIIGGASFNKEAEEFLHRIDFPFTVGYGMTECAPIITYVSCEERKLHSCGRVAPRMNIKIDSSDPNKVPGEILVKGENLFTGYYKNEKDTKAAFNKDGWFRTGDMGVIDDEGYLYLRGRCKSMILGPSGQNIYPEEIENVLNNISYVAESLVIEDNGKLVALVFPDFSQISESDIDWVNGEILKAANEELPKYCQLASIEIVPEEFDKTPKHSIKRYLYQRG